MKYTCVPILKDQLHIQKIINRHWKILSIELWNYQNPYWLNFWQLRWNNLILEVTIINIDKQGLINGTKNLDWLSSLAISIHVYMTHKWLFSDIKISYHKSSFDPVLDELDFLSAMGCPLLFRSPWNLTSSHFSSCVWMSAKETGRWWWEQGENMRWRENRDWLRLISLIQVSFTLQPCPPPKLKGLANKNSHYPAPGDSKTYFWLLYHSWIPWQYLYLLEKASRSICASASGMPCPLLLTFSDPYFSSNKFLFILQDFYHSASYNICSINPWLGEGLYEGTSMQ